VRTVAIRVGAGAALATALVVALAAAFPGQRWNLVAGYELVIGAMALAAIAAALRGFRPRGWEARTPFDGRRDRERQPEALAELERIDRLLVLGATNAFDAHHRVRPFYRELAVERLHAHHGVDLDREPERARELLGDDLWEFVRGDRELGRRYGPGLPIDDAARLADALEAL
jgi:hypothetical protein